MSDDLQEDLIELGLQRYVSMLLGAGYDDWDAVEGMRESDFDALNIRLGDRRKLQREIARRRSWPENSPLPTANELQEYTLCLRGGNVEEAKNRFSHHPLSEALKSEVISTEVETATRDTSPFKVTGEAPRNTIEAPDSSNSILRPELNGFHGAAHDTAEVADLKHPSIVEQKLGKENNQSPA